ncbi:hypothetical protein [Alteromonas halophila]|uniref:Uncharacterized protein n=1 Tax=Alteromonas halophila TaxID=516698 RepID=A0A918JIH6_9ALTE|nr:hypothetical protein [Alteromonas halophila]GGW81675.1 hypothetical protein GCM10007391_13620 [Alteromonas halophila]
MSNLSDALAELKNAIVDFSSLTVTTYSGDLKIIFDNAQKDGQANPSLNTLDMNTLFQAALTNAELAPAQQANFKLEAMNIHKIDGDAIIYRDQAFNQGLEEAHTAAIQAGRETREGFLTLVKGMWS